jgi:winged helix DNA-binding protein
VSRTAGWISPVLVVDGAVAGVWEHERRNGELTVTVRPFAPLPAQVRTATEAQAARYGALLDAATVRVRWS